MICRIDELKNKQVVCVNNGCVLGLVSDIELDTQNGTLTSIVIFGNYKLFGLFGRGEDIVIPWEDIQVIGNETILVTTNPSLFSQEKQRKRV